MHLTYLNDEVIEGTEKQINGSKQAALISACAKASKRYLFNNKLKENVKIGQTS